MKRSQQSVPSVETGSVAGDFSRSQSIGWKNKGGRNATTESARRGAGQLAPRPQVSKQGLLGSTSVSAPVQAGMARVANVGTGNPQGRLPVQSPPANVVGSKIGQPNPQTGAVATAKPKRRGIGAAFFGEY